MTVDHDHNDISTADLDRSSIGFFRKFLEHVRDDHGHAVTMTTPTNRVIDLHQSDHA